MYRPLSLHPQNPHSEAVPTSYTFHNISITPWDRADKAVFPTKDRYIDVIVGMAAERLKLSRLPRLPEWTHIEGPDSQTVVFDIDLGRRPRPGMEAKAAEWENQMGVLLRL